MQMPKNKMPVFVGDIININEWSKIPVNITCVYKLMFDTGKYYIGSTSDLRNRAQVYNSNFTHKKFNIKNLEYEARKSGCCCVEVLEIITDISQLLSREDFFIKLFCGGDILNRSKNAFSNKGIKWTEQEKIAIGRGQKGKKKRKRASKRITRKPQIVKYDLSGAFIKVYTSIKMAAIDNGCSWRTINRRLQENKDRPYNGFVFKKHMSYGC